MHGGAPSSVRDPSQDRGAGFVWLLAPHPGRIRACPVSHGGTLGRDEDAALRLDAPGVAPHHARVVRQGGQLLFVDLGAGPSTANGAPLAPQQPRGVRLPQRVRRGSRGPPRRPERPRAPTPCTIAKRSVARAHFRRGDHDGGERPGGVEHL